MYQILADAILIIHALFVAFVVFGFLWIVAGLARRWSSAQNFWFRLIHLLAIVAVAAQSWWERICPLTTWENRLRQAAGDPGYPGSFIQYWLERLIYYDVSPQWFTLAYTIFAVLVSATWMIRPPRLPFRKGSTPPKQKNG